MCDNGHDVVKVALIENLGLKMNQNFLREQTPNRYKTPSECLVLYRQRGPLSHGIFSTLEHCRQT